MSTAFSNFLFQHSQNGNAKQCNVNLLGGDECNGKKDFFFPGFTHNGNICKLLDFTVHLPPDTSCSCTPTAHEVCNYDSSNVPGADGCFVVDAQDLLNEEDLSCATCLKEECSPTFESCLK